MLRTLNEIRQTILVMPFAITMQLEIEQAGDGIGVVSMPLSDAVSFNETAFAGMAIGIVADVAAGAATLAIMPPGEMALTGAVDTKVTASTIGSRLSARAELRERTHGSLVYDATVTVHGRDGGQRTCGTAVVTMFIPTPTPTPS